MPIGVPSSVVEGKTTGRMHQGQGGKRVCAWGYTGIHAFDGAVHSQDDVVPPIAETGTIGGSLNLRKRGCSQQREWANGNARGEMRGERMNMQ